MQLLWLISILLIVIQINPSLTGLCRLTNDHKNYTCTGFRLRQLTVSKPTKPQILRARISDCKEVQITEGVLPFPNLENLTISCDIEEIHENAFRNLNHLQELDLGNNTISSLPDNLLQSLGELRSLNLSRNNIETLSNSMFNGATNLRQLNLSYNAISDIDIKALSTLKKLEEIYLNDNRIRFIPKELFKGLTKLRHIDFSNNNIEILGELFVPTYTLVHLNVSHNGIEEVSAEAFRTTPLKILDLSFNALTVLHEDALPLDTLQELYLQNNKLSLIQVKGLRSNKIPLHFIELQNNRLVFLEEDFIRKATSLTVINVGGNPWDCGCFTNLESLRSDLTLLTNPNLPLCVAGDSDACNVDRNNLTSYYNIFLQQLDLY